MIRTSDHKGNLQDAVNAALSANDDVAVDSVNLKPLNDTLKIEQFEDGRYRQVCITIHGNANYWDTGDRSLQHFTFSDKPFVGLQQGKGVRIIGMNFSGPSGGNVSGLDTVNDVNAVIAIDYMDPRKMGDNSRAGSTGCVIDNCTFQNAIAGITLSVNGHTQNGDMMLFSNIRFVRCKYGIIGSQAQEKMNQVYRVGCWSEMDTMFVFNGYGQGTAGNYKISVVDTAASQKNGIFYGPKNLIRRSSMKHNAIHITNVFAESLTSIGHWSTGLSDSMSDSTIRFLHPKNNQFPDSHLAGSGVTFDKCEIGYYGYNSPLLLAARDNEYNHCNFTTAPVRGWYNQKDDPDYQQGYEMIFLNRTMIEAVNGKATVITTTVKVVAGDIVFFSSMGNGAWVGQAEVESTAPKSYTLRYISKSVQANTLYNISKYQTN